MDIDQLSRALKDLEYRVKQLEKADRRIRVDELSAVISERYGEAFERMAKSAPTTIASTQFCACGKDRLLCRAPDCPSHKPDPMGR